MPARITIYLQTPVQQLDISTIQKGIDMADWYVLGEALGIGEDNVDQFMQHLQWRNDPLEFGHKENRPVPIHIRNDSEWIKEEIDELNERKLAVKKIPDAVTKHLQKVKTIVSLELGFSQLETMYETIAFEIAYWLAETKQGIILSPSDYWHDHDKYRWNPITK